MIEPVPGRHRRHGLAALALASGLAALAPIPCPAADGPTRLERIKAQGFLTCGLARAQPGFSQFAAKGQAHGFDADFCRAFSAAILNDAKKARFVPVATAREFTARQGIDVAFHRLTVNFTRAVTSGLVFAPVIFHDGQGFLVRGPAGAGSIADLPDSTICAQKGTKIAANLRRFLGESGLGHRPLEVPGADGAARAFFQGRCAALTEDASRLFALAADRMAETFAILDDRISKEPLAPVVRRGDRDLALAMTWVVHAVIHAEEVGVTSANVDDPAIKGDRRRGGFLNLPAALILGLKPDWARAVIKQVGNYGEIYRRHFGAPGAMRLGRGRNRMWRNGGLLHAPPLE